MRLWTTSRSLFDLIIEEVACRTGVLLSDHDVRCSRQQVVFSGGRSYSGATLGNYAANARFPAQIVKLTPCVGGRE